MSLLWSYSISIDNSMVLLGLELPLTTASSTAESPREELGRNRGGVGGRGGTWSVAPTGYHVLLRPLWFVRHWTFSLLAQIVRETTAGQNASRTPSVPYLLEAADLNLTSSVLTSASSYRVSVHPVDFFGTVDTGTSYVTEVLPEPPTVRGSLFVVYSCMN